MLLPSKELLSEVLGNSISSVKDYNEAEKRPSFSRNGDIVFFSRYIAKWDSVNIYEFDHKCKNWATSKGYQFKVYIQTNGEEEWQVGKCGYGWDLFTCKSLQEACEYIMEQTK